ncbi:MAG: hypothetical protein IKM61_05955 [Eubacteriaceae bacterium]|nr:hypothetical protein [Eubacteriaceae bacterium]
MVLIGKSSFKAKNGNDCYLTVWIFPTKRQSYEGLETVTKFVSSSIFAQLFVFNEYDVAFDMNGNITSVSNGRASDFFDIPLA